jgi:hypothetical protein
MTIRVHIERLVLEGLPISRNDGPAVQAAVEGELARLLAGNTPSLSGGATPRVSAPAVALGGNDSPAQVGRQIARSVYGGLGK